MSEFNLTSSRMGSSPIIKVGLAPGKAGSAGAMTYAMQVEYRSPCGKL
jgi:hypothetical protein